MERNKHNKTKVAGVCGISRQPVRKIWNNRNILLENEKNSSFLDAKRPLNAMYPAIEARVMYFICYVRSQCLPVTSSHVKQYARNAAADEGITKFKASNGWLEKFLRQSSIQPSLWLHGKGGNTQVPGTDDRMEEIRGILSTYELKNIYNVDESGLFYRMGPNRTYLTASENRAETRGTEMQKYKQRVSIEMCVNADGSHAFPVHYIGNSRNPMCLKSAQFSHLKSNYWSQPNGWMDSKGFDHWL